MLISVGIISIDILISNDAIVNGKHDILFCIIYVSLFLVFVALINFCYAYDYDFVCFGISLSNPGKLSLW